MLLEWIPHLKALKTVPAADLEGTYQNVPALEALKRSFDMLSIFP